MIKTMAILPVVVLIVIGIGLGACTSGGLTLHGREMIAAAVIMLISAEAACVPGVMLRRADTATISQAALGGTVIQMLLSVALAALLWVVKVKVEPTPFVAWMMAFYFATLAALVTGLCLAFGRAPAPRAAN